MQLPTEPSFSSARAPETLHQAILMLGRQWLPWGARSHAPRLRVRQVHMAGRYDLGTTLLDARNAEMTIRQLTTALRMQGIDSESEAMLELLESLILAGEISFADFMNRVQHLFPHGMDKIDRSLRVKLSALLID